MLSRFISRPSRLRFLTLIYSNNASLYSPSPPSSLPPSGSIQNYIFKPDCRFVLGPSRYFSSNRKNNGNGNNNDPSSSTYWKISSENDNEQSIFGDEEGNLAGITDDVGDFGSGVEKSSDVISQAENDSWSKDSNENVDIFADIDKEFESKKEDRGDEWVTAEGYKPWSFGDEGKEDVFDIGETFEGLPSVGEESLEREVSEADKHLEKEEQELSVVLKGPNRAFGDLIAASGITEAMLDSLIALKDLEHVEGLPPLREIEDMRLEKNESKSIRSEIERKKQEEIAKSRVRQVDEKGRAYGTGRRKCSIARVWIQPGDGKFLINDKHFDVYFPILDHRADLLRPFAETKTLGLWDVKCTVKGGGVSGQVGAVRLGISRALQNWEPGLRPYLKSAGFLTRDPRVVERKKPGKAKARKSFQWVKR